MIIENLTRFLPACSLGNVPMPLMVQTLDEDSYVRFLDVKAVIADIVKEYSTLSVGSSFKDNFESLLERVQQLLTFSDK